MPSSTSLLVGQLSDPGHCDLGHYDLEHFQSDGNPLCELSEATVQVAT